MAKKEEDDDDLKDTPDIEDDADEKDEESGDADNSDESSKKEEEVEVVIENDEKDERVAIRKNKNYSEETLEEKRARRRAERKRNRHQAYLNQQNLHKFESENAELKKRLEALEAFTPKFQQRVDAQDEAQVDTAINSQINLYKTAELNLEKAITEGNGAAAKEAQRIMFDSNNKYNQLVALKQKYKDTANAEKEVKREPPKKEIGEAQKMYTRRWMNDNAWFHPDGSDEDSETAKIIAQQVEKDGLDPNRREFWDEVNDRLKEELPHIFEEKPARRAASPRPKQVNGSQGADSAPNNARTIKIPESVKKMAVDAGFWDNPKMKKVFIKNWLEQQQNTKAN